MKLNSPAPLGKDHEAASFDCGVEPLNFHLREFALQNHQNRASRTYVATRGETIVGYYTLSKGSVSLDQVPKRVAQGMGSYPVPVTLLARLAVDITEKGAGWGCGLMKDALLRAFQASELVGSRAILTHAKDESARTFYERFNFERSPLNEFHLYLLMKDIRGLFSTATES